MSLSGCNKCRCVPCRCTASVGHYCSAGEPWKSEAREVSTGEMFTMQSLLDRNKALTADLARVTAERDVFMEHWRNCSAATERDSARTWAKRWKDAAKLHKMGEGNTEMFFDEMKAERDRLSARLTAAERVVEAARPFHGCIHHLRRYPDKECVACNFDRALAALDSATVGGKEDG